MVCAPWLLPPHQTSPRRTPHRPHAASSGRQRLPGHVLCPTPSITVARGGNRKREVAGSERIQGHDQTEGENTMLRFLSRVPLRSGAWRVFVAPVAAGGGVSPPARKGAAPATLPPAPPVRAGGIKPLPREGVFRPGALPPQT